MTVLEIKLASLVVHLAELHSPDGCPHDMLAITSLLKDSAVRQMLKPGPLIPLTRSGKSAAELITKLQGAPHGLG